MKAITVALFFTLMLFFSIGWLFWRSYQDYKVAPSQEYRHQFLINSLNSGPRLTAIARRASQKGDLSERNEYEYLAHDVDNAIKEIVPAVQSSVYHPSRPPSKLLTRTLEVGSSNEIWMLSM